MSAIEWPQAGELRHRIVLRLWRDVPAAFSRVDQIMEDPGRTLWAKKQPTSGVRYWSGKQIGEEATHLFWVRWQACKPENATGEHVIEHAGRRYRVIRATDAGGANVMTMIETKDLGEIPQ